MGDAQLHMPAPVAKAVNERGGEYFRRMHDPDFGVCWLIPSIEGARLAEQNWHAGSEWFGEIAPVLVDWICAFPSASAAIMPTYIQAHADDFKANEREVLAFKRRRLGSEDASDADVQAKFISQGHLTPPDSTQGWIPQYLPHGAVKMDVSAHHRRVFVALGAKFEKFTLAAQKQAAEAKQSNAQLVFTELLLLGDRDVLAVGHYGDSYASFFVRDDLMPSLNELD